METIVKNIVTEKRNTQDVQSASKATIPVIRRVQDAQYTSTSKRVFDVAVSALLLVTLFSWLLPVLYLLIKATSRGNAFFIQERMGRNGRIFRCYKFRTMYINNEADTKEVTQDDKRITPIGKWLRRTHIDELPQLINVLKGEMSIVGPRPHMLFHHQQFCKSMPYYNTRHLVKPGITGLAQVKGYHGTIQDYYSIYGRTRLDLFYVKKSSLLFDLTILLKTIAIIYY